MGLLSLTRDLYLSCSHSSYLIIIDDVVDQFYEEFSIIFYYGLAISVRCTGMRIENRVYDRAR